MAKTIILLLFFSLNLFSKCSEVPENLRKNYASWMYNAFQLQCQGKSALAMTQFNLAYEEGKKCGESLTRLNAIQQLFVWYRTYGSSLRLFEKQLTGYDRIIGEYTPRMQMSIQTKHYQSEWGKDPEQAALIRDFMFGVGEVLSGVFCVTLSYGTAATIGWGVATDGAFRIWSSLNQVWANHHALTALKQWEQGPLKSASNE